jgi:tetratricopeptide (TPR) repeat protein
MSRFDAAEKELRRASELQPQNPLPVLALARLYATRNQADRAIVAYDGVLKIVPKSLEALIEKGDVLFASKQSLKALQSYQTALGYAPGSAVIHLKIGMVEQDQGRTAQAEAAYTAAIKADPKQAVAYNNLAWMAAERKTRLAEALTWAQKAVSLDPKVPAFHGTLGWVYRARGETDKAVTSLEQAAALGPTQAEVQYRLGLVYSEKGLRDKAIAALRKAVAAKYSYKELDEARKLLTRLESSRG